MTLEEVKKYYGLSTDVEVGKLFGVSKVAVGDWGKTGIPQPRQAIIQILSNNNLTANLSNYQLKEQPK